MGCSESKASPQNSNVDVVAALRKTPFFIAACNLVQGSSVATASLLEDIARQCACHQMTSGSTFEDLPKGLDGAFAIVVSGELVHTSLIGRRGSWRNNMKNFGRASRVGLAGEVIATRKPGDFFQMGGFATKESRNAGLFVLRAIEDSVVITLKRSDLAEVLPRHEATPVAATSRDPSAEDHSHIKVLNAISRADFYMLLKTSPYFKGLSPSHLNALSELFTFQALRPRSKLYGEGDFANFMCADGHPCADRDLLKQCCVLRRAGTSYLTANYRYPSTEKIFVHTLTKRSWARRRSCTAQSERSACRQETEQLLSSGCTRSTLKLSQD